MPATPTARPLRPWHATLGLTVVFAIMAGVGVQEQRPDLATGDVDGHGPAPASDSAGPAAIALFVASAVTEIPQKYWPAGLFRGRFDPLDLVAFTVGLLLVYAVDRWLHPAPGRRGLLLLTLLSAARPASGQAIAQTDDAMLRRMAATLNQLGYSDQGRTGAVFIQSAVSRGPTYVPGLGSDGGRLMMGRVRPCGDSLRSTIPDCVRFDGIEAYAARPDSLRGVIPFTLAGRAGQPLPEVPVSPEAVADAATAAAKLKVRLFRPPPMPPLPVTPDE